MELELLLKFSLESSAGKVEGKERITGAEVAVDSGKVGVSWDPWKSSLGT